MSASLRRSSEPAFFDLIPWADPYIVSLIEKLRHGEGGLLGDAMAVHRRVRAEAPPPLDVDFPTPGDGPDDDWAQRRTE